MTKVKLSQLAINEIGRQMNSMENLGIGFTDFDFNVLLAKWKNEVQLLSEAYDAAIDKCMAEKKKKGEVMTNADIDIILAKKHEVEIPEFTMDQVKSTASQLPVSVIAMLLKYVKK